MAGSGSNTALEAGVELDEQHDEWLKDRGWYDIITRTLGDNWRGEDDGYLYDAE